MTDSFNRAEKRNTVSSGCLLLTLGLGVQMMMMMIMVEATTKKIVGAQKNKKPLLVNFIQTVQTTTAL